jgi:plastocyanin
MKLAVFIMVLLMLGFLSLGASGCGQTQSPNQNQGQSQLTVSISNFAFNPSTLTVKAGETVTWTNQDSATHTILSDSGNEISSSSLGQGQTYSHTFNQSGTYSYHCSIHPSMKATIIVQ